MGFFHRHRWQETSISFKISSPPTQSVYEHVIRCCRKCGERQVWVNGGWIKANKDPEVTKRLYHKAIQLITELMREELDE